MYFRYAKYILALLFVFVVIYSFQYLDAKNQKQASTAAEAESSNAAHNLKAGGLLFRSKNNQRTNGEKTNEHQSEKCKNLQKPSESEVHHRHTYWQVQQDGEEEIVVYSAFYDDRPIVGHLPCIRILGVRRLSTKPVWCYVWYSGKKNPFVTRAEIVKTGRNQKIPGLYVYSQNMFTCPLGSADSVPTHVSIATRQCAAWTTCLPIANPQGGGGELSHNVGVCLDESFGYFSSELIVEWMEMNSMFGVTKVSVFNGSFDGKLNQVFEYYRKAGFVDLRRMPPAVEYEGVKGVGLSRGVSLNDCMLRNMFSRRFVLIADFDEIVVPRLHRTYPEMLDHLDSLSHLPNSHHTYSFRNVDFFRQFPQDSSQPEFLRTLRMRYRVEPFRFLVRTKSFIDPRRCKSVFDDYCLARFDKKDFLTVDVNTSVALNHRYRSKCPFSSARCERYGKERIQDDIMLKYRDVLLRRVSSALKAIGASSS